MRADGTDGEGGKQQRGSNVEKRNGAGSGGEEKKKQQKRKGRNKWVFVPFYKSGPQEVSRCLIKNKRAADINGNNNQMLKN